MAPKAAAVVGSDNSAGHAELHGLDDEAVDRASNGDRSWFKRHVDRGHRVRPAKEAELPTWGRPSGPGRLFAVVGQVQPGTRLRLYFKATAQPCGCEFCASTMWSRLAGQRGAEARMALATMGLKP